MDCRKVPFIIVTLFYLFISSSGEGRGDVSGSDIKYIDEAVQIVNTIFHNYKEIVPPRGFYPDPVYLGIHLNVLYVSDFDQVAQTLTSTVELEVTWNDTRLSWYPVGVYEITIPQDKVWSPNLSMNNAIGAPSLIDDQKYVIKHTGLLYMHKRMQLTTTCATNHTDDSAICEITVGSNLVNHEIIDFNEEQSSCDVSSNDVDHRIEVSLEGVEKRPTERPLLKANETYPEFACRMKVRLTGCCGSMKSSPANRKQENGAVVSQFYMFTLLVAFIISMLVIDSRI
ncbi:hypothetical protein ACF0H5_023215 [Mactra antiquata]